MPSKAVCCGGKAVLVSVYVERPRRGSSNAHPHIRQTPAHHQKVSGGPNRRENLLRYSQQLRKFSAVESAVSTPPHRSSNKIIPIQGRQKRSKTPTCFGDWKALIPGFLRSLVGHKGRKQKKKRSGLAPNKMTATMKNLYVRNTRKQGFKTGYNAT